MSNFNVRDMTKKKAKIKIANENAIELNRLINSGAARKFSKWGSIIIDAM